jgi:hypothetical protein
MSSSQVCRRCRASFPLESFPKSINGTRTLKTCGTCSREEGDVRRQKIKKIPTTDSTESHCQRGPGHRVDQKKVSCDDLVAELQSRCRTQAVGRLDFSTDVSALGFRESMGRKERADEVRRYIESVMPWKFTCVHTYILRQYFTTNFIWPYSYHERVRPEPSPTSDTFQYICAQRQESQRKQKLTEDIENQRDRAYMQRFNCAGELRITVHSHDPKYIRVVLVHEIHHIPYCDISLPEEVKAIIRDQKGVTVRDVRFQGIQFSYLPQH